MAERIKGLQIDLSMKDMGIGATLAGVKRSFKTLNSDLKLSRNNFRNSEKTMTSYKNRIRELDGATKQQRNNVKELRKQYQQTAKEQGANSAKAARLRTEYNKQADTLNYLEHELEQTTSSFKNFQKESQAAARVSNSSFGRLGKSFTEMGPKINKVGESMKSVGRSMSMYVTAPVVAGFGLAAKTSIDFDDSMRKVKATSGATGKEFNSLRDKALEMGAKTKFSASESADALNYMALAGWDSKQMMSGISGVMDLAAASGEDLGQVSDIVTDSLTAFGMKAKDSGKFADVLAQTSSKANTDVKGLGDAFKYAAPVAGALGYSVEDTSIAIGLMSNAGIKGEKAGTALRTMFTNLSKPTKAMKNKMDELGISITDSNGEMLPMRDVMDQLRSSMGGLSKDQQAAAAATIFGKESMSGALAVVNASEKDYKKLTKSIDGSKGASKRMAKEMEGGIGGSMRKMKSAVESLAISIGDVVAPFIGKAADAIAGLATKLTNLPGWLQGTIVAFGALAAAIGPIVLVAGLFTASIGSIMGVLGPLMVGIKEAGGAMAFLTSKAPLVAIALKGIGSAATFMLGPWGLVIAGVVALGTALVVAYKKSETFRNIVNGALTAVVNGFKALWSGVMTVLTPIGQAIGKFGQQIAKTFSQFWAENGPQFMQALNNIKTGFVVMWTFIQPVLSQIGSLFKTVFSGILSFIQFIMPAIQAIFKVGWTLIKYIFVSTWQAIKGVVMGGLNVIMGVIKVFSGIFTGDFRKMWEGVKQIFFGAFQFIWNLVQLWFVGKIFGVFKLGLNLIKSIVSGSLGAVRGTFSGILGSIWGIVRNIFTYIWNFIKLIFTNIANFTRAIWNNIKLLVTNPVRGIYNIVTAQFRLLSSIARAIFSALSKVIGAIWRGIRNTVVAIAKGLYNAIRNRFHLLKNIVFSITRALGNALKATWTWIKNTIVGLARSLYNTAKNVFTTMSNVLRAITSTLSKIVKSIWSGLRNAVVKTIRALFNTARSIFNSIRKTLTNITQGLKNAVTGKWQALKKSITNLATGAKNGVVNGFKGMYNKGVEWMNKLKGFITNAKEGFKKVATSLGKGVANGAISGLNAMIDGINSLSNKIMKKKLIKKSIPKLSTGTGVNPAVKTDSQGRLKRSTKAIVNDKGFGNGKGPNGHKELIYRKGGKIEQPRGNNKKVSLKRGDGVINGTQAKALRPHLASGTGLKDKLFDTVASGAGVVKDTASKGYHKAKSGASSLIEGGKDLAGKAKAAFDKAIGDVKDYIKNPMKLIDKTLKFFGVDFSNVKGEAMGGMMSFGYNGLKNMIKDLVTGWFDELEGGDGDASWLLNGKHPILQTFGNYTGGLMFNGGRHYGIDFGMPTGTKIKALTDGTVTQAGAVAGGGGNQVTLKEPGGKWYQWYMHMSKILTKKGAKVKAGDLLGLSGNTGNSTTPHLHIQRMKGYPSNETAVNPMSWLKSLTGGGKYASTIKKALGLAGLPQTDKYIKAWQSQAKTESTFNPKAKNPSGASGLVQVKPATFNQYKLPGHGNIWNPLDNLIAGMRYAKARYGPKKMLNQIGHGLPYKNGTNYATKGLHNVFEEGGEIINMRGGEQVIPNDVSVAAIERVVNSDVYGKTQSAVAHVIKQYADQIRSRENDIPRKHNSFHSNDAKYYKQMIERQDKTISKLEQSIDLLTKMVASTRNIEQQPKGFTERDVSKAQGRRSRNQTYITGGVL
ncbi:phage tail tape measure protein [Staphylococcus carnosus]|uniref:phage tail tape measure protein n=1 Tax=Staphylococcus carnosus TaxID=1281 RepID=UPI00081A62A3|nr:phage tail tape measure protein [Staphylococcus carnosus]ANZ33073.1 phage tail tape measure protein [Staphylococcus carnosus]UTB85212.1 phage tail tape measure protein [Staphylococcus carnosus]